MDLSTLDMIDYGMVLDMFSERANDEEKYDYVATQEDFDRF